MAFADRLYADDSSLAYAEAQVLADMNGSPVGIWKRDSWLTIDENPPEDDNDPREAAGWALSAIVDPSATDCLTCDGYVLNPSEAPYCPTCARERAK